ncbi:hypothetical protein [Longimicrobium sp.]|jgi:hypothetical protein|uniref:hypothetical protein n=1 Tax=Longimicrobium sp. TaxID=2029185 RepID=UPI002F95442D
MSFNLEIEFTGLCMFVPTADGSAVHVLMPKGDGMAAHPAHHGTHRAGVEDTTSTGSTGTPVPHHLARLTFGRASDWIDGMTLDFSHLGGRPHGPVPEGLLNLSKATLVNQKVNLAGVTGQLNSRVILRGGCISHHYGLARWNFENHPPAYLAHWVTWTVPDIAGQELDLYRANLDGTNAQPFRTIEVDDGKTIRLLVHHLPRGERPHGPTEPAPNVGWADHHFHGYFRLFSKPVTDPKRITPRFLDKGWGLPTTIPNSCVSVEKRSSLAFQPWSIEGRTYTCWAVAAEAE